MSMISNIRKICFLSGKVSEKVTFPVFIHKHFQGHKYYFQKSIIRWMEWDPFLDVLPLPTAFNPNTECVNLKLTLYTQASSISFQLIIVKALNILVELLTWYKCISMPLKYDSMPKITFCFKDYLEELRIIFALQVLPVLETHVCQVCFPWASMLTVQGGKRKQSVNELEMLPLKQKKLHL